MSATGRADVDLRGAGGGPLLRRRELEASRGQSPAARTIGAAGDAAASSGGEVEGGRGATGIGDVDVFDAPGERRKQFEGSRGQGAPGELPLGSG